MTERVGSTSAGWFADPADARLLRWWDGTGWTEHVSAGSPRSVPQPTPSAAELLERVSGAHAAGIDAVDVEPLPRRSGRGMRPRDDRAAGRAAYLPSTTHE